MVTNPTKTKTGRSAGLTTGDGIAIVALLAFIVGWVAFWVWVFSDAPDKTISGWTAGFLILLFLSPTLWAARLVNHLIEGGDDNG